MGTCRFLLDNLVLNATILNGSGGSPPPPARSEVAPWVMERALNSDRLAVHRWGAPNDTIAFGSGFQLDLDLGANYPVDTVTLHGLSVIGGQLSGVSVHHYTSYPSGSPVTVYDDVFLDSNRRDQWVSFPSASARYWTVLIQATGAPIVGRIAMGQITDLDIAPNPGAKSSPFQNRLEQQLPDGSLNLNHQGYTGRNFAWTFDPVYTAMADQLEALVDRKGSLIYIDPDDRVFEIAIRGGAADISRVTQGLQSVSLEGVRLP